MMISLGAQIRQARKGLKLSQAELAARTGVSRVSLSALERGTVQDIGIRKVMRILEFLGLELSIRPAGAPPTLDELKEEQGRYEG